MKLAGFAGVVAALGMGCLEAPPTGSAPDGDGGPDGGAPPPPLQFPPEGAAVHVVAALAADVDGDEREDLVLLDDDVDDDLAGVYVLRAGEAGWAGVAEVRLDFKPHSVWFGRDVRPASPALVVGGASGRVAVVAYEPEDDSFAVKELEFDPAAAGAISIIHSGRMVAGDETATLFVDDGASLFLSDPIDDAVPIAMFSLAAGGVLDAAFWPLQSSNPIDFFAWRRTTMIEWQVDKEYDRETVGNLTEARFAHVDASLCGTYLGLASDMTPWVGWIECDRSGSQLAPIEGADIPLVTAMAAGDLGGGPKHDIALVGVDGKALVGQVLIDVGLMDDGTPSFVAEEVTESLTLEGILPARTFVTPVDVQGDGTAVVYGITAAGAMFCGEVVGAAVQPCTPEWTVRER